MSVRTPMLLALVGVFALTGATLGTDEMTLTGAVGDADCGVTHQMPGTSASCTPSCALGFSWTLDCERVLAGGVSR